MNKAINFNLKTINFEENALHLKFIIFYSSNIVGK